MSTEELLDSLVRVLTERSKNKRNIIAYLYLWISVMHNISICEAFRRYAWIEMPTNNNRIGIRQKEIMCTTGCLSSITIGKIEITLVPRSRILECEMPYREAALQMVELFKEILNVQEQWKYQI